MKKKENFKKGMLRVLSSRIRELLDYGMKVMDSKHRLFAKATAFPFLVTAEREIYGIGKWNIVVTAESRSRLRKGIVGISAFKIINTAKDSGHILVWEGNDSGDAFIYNYNAQCVRQYASCHGLNCDDDESLKKVVLRLMREVYFVDSFHGPDNVDDTGENFRYHKIVSNEGVFLGMSYENDRFFYFLEYQSLDEHFENDEETRQFAMSNIENMRKAYDENPWEYSPYRDFCYSDEKPN